jgi:dihydrolipoamide dehydrogenase
MTYDFVILGAGPAGYIAALRAANAGLNTLIIEKSEIGGVCLNEGCIPTKTLLYSAKIYDNAKEGQKYGVVAKEITLNHEAVIERKNRIVRSLVSSVKAKLKKSNVTVVSGFGQISGRVSEGYSVITDKSTYIGKRLLLSTGSTPILPNIPGLNEGLKSGFVLTNKEILDLKNIPKELVVIGGGVIGLEMASYFNTAGSKVTVIEMLDHVGGEIDKEISALLLKNHKKKSIEFKLSSKVVRIGGKSVIFESGGETHEIIADKVLLSVGRRAVTEGIGLDIIGVEIVNGVIKTDSRGKTNLPEVYAAGDCTGNFMLAHAAYREAEVCVNNILGKKDVMRYNAIPSVIYTNPEVASIGFTEQTAKAAGIDYETSTLSMKYSGRYTAENEDGDGICKVLVEKSTRKILGAHMIGNYSSEIIYGAAIMIEMEMRIKDIKEIVFPHPTVSEILREIAFEI